MMDRAVRPAREGRIGVPASSRPSAEQSPRSFVRLSQQGLLRADLIAASRCQEDRRQQDNWWQRDQGTTDQEAWLRPSSLLHISVKSAGCAFCPSLKPCPPSLIFSISSTSHLLQLIFLSRLPTFKHYYTSKAGGQNHIATVPFQ